MYFHPSDGTPSLCFIIKRDAATRPHGMTHYGLEVVTLGEQVGAH